MNKRQKIVFFDIDGTLLNTGGAGQMGLERALHDAFDVEFPFQGVLTAGRTDRGIVDEIFDTHSIEKTSENRLRFRDHYLKHLPECLQAAPGRLLPAVTDLLDAVAAIDGLQLAVLTGNYEKSAWIKLRHYEVGSYFSCGGFGDEHAARNDVAAQALAAAQHTYGEVRAADTMVIGDTLADLACARSIGAKACGVATGSYDFNSLQAHDNDHVFPDFSDTSACVTRITELLELSA